MSNEKLSDRDLTYLRDAMGGSSAPDRDTFIANLLEAAARVEEGSWP